MISYIFFIFLLVIAVILSILISVTDFRRRIIPDAYLFPLMLIGLTLIAFYSFPITLQSAVIGGAFGYLMSAIIGAGFDYYMTAKNPDASAPIGMGDIKLLGVGGLWLGTNGLAIALIISCLLGILWAKRKNQKYIPFAPFFFIGGFLSFIINIILL